MSDARKNSKGGSSAESGRPMFPGAYRQSTQQHEAVDKSGIKQDGETESVTHDDNYETEEPDMSRAVPWYRQIPKAGRFICFSTLSVLLGLVLLASGLFYIDTVQNGAEGTAGFISEALNSISEYSGERAFKGSDRMNILCLGIDYNRDSRGIAYTKGARSDTIFVVSIDAKGQTLNVVSIPRDCYVYLGDDYGYDKINAAYMYGGIKLTRKVVSEFLGVPIHHYVIIKVSGASQLVDALGGLVVDVEKDMNYDDNWGNLHIHLKAGEQLLRGEQAVGYARFRMDAESDRGRIRRQQQVMMSVIKRLKDPMVVLRLQSIVKAVKQNIETDFSLLDMLDLTYLYKDFDRKRMKTGVIVGDDSDINGVSYIMPYAPMNEKIVLELLKDPSSLQREDVRVEVLNGSSEEGLEGRIADYLSREGFRVVNVGTAKEPCEVTTIVDHLGSAAMRNCLESLLLSCYYEVDKLPYDKRKADVTIIVGEDRVNCGLYDSGNSYRSPKAENRTYYQEPSYDYHGNNENYGFDSSTSSDVGESYDNGAYPQVNSDGTVVSSEREFGAPSEAAPNNEPVQSVQPVQPDNAAVPPASSEELGQVENTEKFTFPIPAPVDEEYLAPLPEEVEVPSDGAVTESDTEVD
ncbi:MAG: LCP family protein [Candidatus Bruticola sp.]